MQQDLIIVFMKCLLGQNIQKGIECLHENWTENSIRVENESGVEKFVLENGENSRTLVIEEGNGDLKKIEALISQLSAFIQCSGKNNLNNYNFRRRVGN